MGQVCAPAGPGLRTGRHIVSPGDRDANPKMRGQLVTSAELNLAQAIEPKITM
jgi:hypothetical protein